ncbi:MAG: hypothetical protein AAGE98_15865 [Actinomycetota bacterium]
MASSITERKALLLDELVWLIELLDAVGADHWVRHLVAAFERIDAGDPAGVRAVLDAFSGAGTLSEVRVEPLDDGDVDPGLVDEANQDLNERRAAVFRQAQALARELDV